MNQFIILRKNKVVEPPVSIFQEGDLRLLYPLETASQIKTRRQSNWDILKSTVNTSKLTNDPIDFPNTRIEFFRPLNDIISIGSGQNMYFSGLGATSLVFYPFVFRAENAERTPFQIGYGANINLQNLTLKCAQKQGKFESYSAIIKKSGNPRLVELQGSIRPEFWTDLTIGDTIWLSWDPAVVSNARIVSSFDSVAKTITITADVTGSIPSDSPGDMARMFTNEIISEEDYNTYGEFWIHATGTKFGASGIRLGPGPNTGDEVSFDIRNVTIENFWIGLDISAGNWHVDFSNLTFSNCGVAFGGFARSQLNGQYISGDTLTFIENGYRCIAQITTDASLIYGSGGYIHPTVIITISEQLLLIDNIAAAFRQYSSSVEQVNPEGQFTYIKKIMSTGSEEYDFYSSNCMPVIIDDFFGDSELRLGGTITINTGTLPRTLANTLLHPADGVASKWTFNDCIFSDGLVFDWPVLSSQFLDIELNDCEIVAAPTGDINSIIKNEGSPSGYIHLNNCTWTNPGTVSVYVPGTAPVGTATRYLFAGQHAYSEIIIDGLVADPMVGGLFLYDTLMARETDKIIQINNSSIPISKLVDTAPTSLPVFRSNQIIGSKTSLTGIYNGAGYNLPSAISPKDGFLIKAVTTSVALTAYSDVVSTVTTANVLEIDYDHNIYQTSGTISHIAPIVLAASGVKVKCTSIFAGEITLMATAGSITLVAYDPVTNPNGNITTGLVVPMGDSVTLLCDNTHVFALGTSAVSETTGSDFEILDNNLIVNGSFSGVGTVDYLTGIYNGVAGSSISYNKYVNWKNTGAWIVQ